jgi:peptide/nickel transport system permease protein
MLAWRRGGLFEAGATLGGVAAYTSFAPWLGFVAINVFGWYLGWFPYQRLVDHNVWFRSPVTVDWLLGRMVTTIGLALAVLVPLWQITRRPESHRRGLLRPPFHLQWKERWFWRAVGLLLVGGGAWAWWARSGLGYLALDVLAHLALPLGTVVLLSFGETMMIMRAAMLETLDEDYVLIARAKGLPDKVIRDRHVARNALLPVITRLMLNLPFVLVGSLVIERVFMWQAMGRIIFDAVEYLDIPVLLGILSVVGVVVLALHVVLDILYVYLDPRLRYAGES